MSVKPSHSPRGGEIDTSDIRLLEAYLDASLKPIHPRTEYLDAARQRLTQYTPPPATFPPALRYTLIFLLGLLSSAVIVIAGVKIAQMKRNTERSR